MIRRKLYEKNNQQDTEALLAELEALKAKIALLERNDEDNAEAINDLSEDMRRELDALYNAIGALSIKPQQVEPPRRPIGYKKSDYTLE